MKFVHIADIHFDSPFVNLSDRENLGDIKRLEQRKVFKKVIEYIKENGVDFLFIAGDLYEQQYIRKSTIEYINEIFKEIPNTKIYISPGNHDPYIKNSYYNQFKWNDNVHIFSSKFERLTSDNVDIYGYGFDDFYCTNCGIENLEIEDKNGNIWKLNDTIIHGQDVFNFTIEVAPQNIKDVMEYAQKTDSDIDYYAIHQANKQIVESVAMKADIPDDKYSSETFSKYGNNSTTSVATAICDQLEGKKYNTILLSAFGVGLSWASAIININNLYNGGISYFIPPENMLTREEQIQYWIKQFKGE